MINSKMTNVQMSINLEIIQKGSSEQPTSMERCTLEICLMATNSTNKKKSFDFDKEFERLDNHPKCSFSLVAAAWFHLFYLNFEKISN